MHRLAASASSLVLVLSVKYPQPNSLLWNLGLNPEREWCQNHHDGFWEESIEPMESANDLSRIMSPRSVLRLEIQPQITHAGKGLKIWTHHAELWWSIRRHQEVKLQQKLRRLSQRLLSFTTPLQLIGSTGPPSSTLPWRYCSPN